MIFAAKVKKKPQSAHAIISFETISKQIETWTQSRCDCRRRDELTIFNDNFIDIFPKIDYFCSAKFINHNIKPFLLYSNYEAF